MEIKIIIPDEHVALAKELREKYRGTNPGMDVSVESILQAAVMFGLGRHVQGNLKAFIASLDRKNTQKED